MSGVAASRLARALVRALVGQAAPAQLVEAHSREWRSATFAGVLHRLALVGPPDTRRRIEALAPEALDAPGELVADLRVVGCAAAGAQVRVVLEALTVRA